MVVYNLADWSEVWLADCSDRRQRAAVDPLLESRRLRRDEGWASSRDSPPAWGLLLSFSKLGLLSLLHYYYILPLPGNMQAAEIKTEELPPLPIRRGFRQWYSQPIVQVSLIAMVCFLCPG